MDDGIYCGAISDHNKKLISRFANSDLPILITGPSGTGKEILANMIHKESGRGGPLIAVNCGCFAWDLGIINSELFGHTKGAFTGANSNHIGVFEEASGGTLFLDEIGDLRPEIQVKLLRVLQDGSFYRLGCPKKRFSSARIVAATNIPVADLVPSEKMREDLYYRLAGVTISTDPLEGNTSLIEELSRFLLKKYTSDREDQESLRFSETVMEIFSTYSWPGNIREMDSTIRYAVAMSNCRIIRQEDLPEQFLGGCGVPNDEVSRSDRTLDSTKEVFKDSKTPEEAYDAIADKLLDVFGEDGDKILGSLEIIESKILHSLIRKYKWNMSRLARFLGIWVTTLRYKLVKYDLIRKDENKDDFDV